MKGILLFPFRWFKSQSRRKKIISSIIFVVGLLVVVRSFSGKKGATYMTELPKHETITETVTETGNIVTSASAEVYSTTTGIVEKLAVANGTVVKVGDPLFAVRTSATQQEKDTARSNYLSAKSSLDAAKATQLSLQASMYGSWDQYKTLAEGDKYEDADGNPKTDNRTLPEFVISQKEWEAAEANFKNQDQKIAQAQAATNAMYDAYQATLDSTVKSPLAGTIYNLSIAETDAVIAKSATNLLPVLVVADLSRTRVKVELNEVDIPKVTVGQKVSIAIDALPDKTFEGTVVSVDSIGQNIQGVVTYNVYIDITNSELGIKPGMTATVNIEVAKKENALTVSSSAIRPYEGKRAVQVVDPTTKSPKYIPVEIGLKSDDRTEIISGIDENTAVITSLSNDQIKRPGGGIFGG